MKFARVTFRIAGVWGFLVLIPMFFLFPSVAALAGTSPAMYQFYFGFNSLALVFQVVFLVIAQDPVRYRPLMLCSVLEKASYVIPMAILLALGHVGWAEWATSVPDAVLGALFGIAFSRTPRLLQ